MHYPDREAAPFFSKPIRQILSMLIVLGLVAVGGFVAMPAVLPVFQANLYLNGFIAFVFAIGVVTCFLQVFQLFYSVNWIVDFAANRAGHQYTKAPRLLAPLAALLRSRAARMQIGASSARSILDSVSTRIDEARDITRYIVNLLIFLGLLGTFFGLATTVPAVVDTIRALNPGEDEGGTQLFNRLMSGLEDQLGGMGVAFSSSLLGLAGSLVVGLLELFAGHGQNRFYRELEEWLSTITKLGFATEGDSPPEAGAGDAMPTHIAGQMEHFLALAGAIDRIADRLEVQKGTSAVLVRIAEGQEKLIAVLEAAGATGGLLVDAESRMRLRSIDVQLLRILEEMSAGRLETADDLRSDLAELTRAIRDAGAPHTRAGDGQG